HDLEQGALARAVEAHQADRLALLNPERHVVEGTERVGDLLTTGHRHRHLLEGAVVRLGELLRHVLDDDRVGHQSLSGILVSQWLKTRWAMIRRTNPIPRAMKPRMKSSSGMAVPTVASGSLVVGAQKQRCTSSTATAI